MAKKLISVLLAVLLVFSLATTCFASSSEQETTEEAVLIKSNGEREYGSLKELLANAYGTNVTVQLLKDITYQADSYDYGGIYASYGVGGDDGVRCNLDLGGHTITVTATLDSNCISFSAIYVAQYSCEISNGTIVADVKTSGKMEYPYVAEYQIANLYEIEEKLSNLILTSTDPSIIDCGVSLSWPKNYSLTPSVELVNVTIDACNTAIKCIATGTGDAKGKVDIKSGCYENLRLNHESSDYSVTYGTLLTVPGVNNGASVYTSPATTAMIVKDGNAYLYDTLQDAVDAVDADGTIYLLKQPSDEKVTVPEEAGFRIVPFGDGSKVDTGKLQLVTASGNKASVDEDGYIVIEQPWIVTLDNGKGAAETYEVIKGQPFTFPAAPSKPGYIFLGWRGADGRTYNTGDVVEISGDTTFKAIWGNLPDVTEPSEPDEPVVPVFPFNDVTARDWYYSAVRYVYEKGLMDGVDVGVFAPDDTLTRAMVWTIIARAEGVDTTGGATWYAKAQEYVTAKGISDGENPNAPITREQLVTMLYRLAGEPAVSGTITAPDAASVSTWAADAMTWAMSTGIIEGDENGAVTPTATATRAQAAAIFMRFIENIK